MRVVVAIITDKRQRVLITRRSLDKPFGGLWEFPGGKIEEGERPISALIREVKEEVGLDVIDFNYLGEINHVYEQQFISLLIYNINQYTGTASCLESQGGLCWVDIAQLKNYTFPTANIDIIRIIQQNIVTPHHVIPSAARDLLSSGEDTKN